jgi:transcriptional regulator with XRE-family HTH domain
MARPKSIAVWIRKNRQANGWSQVDLAKALDYQNSSSVNQWESGAKQPPATAMEKLEELFGSFDATPAKDQLPEETEPASDFALWLRSERQRQQLTLMQLAERSGVNVSTISQIENSKISSPQEKTWNKLVNALENRSPALGQADLAPTQDKDESRATAGLGELRGFNPYADEERPTVGGIYVLYDISDRPVYVGEGGNIRKRIKDHEEKFWFKRPIVETAAYIEVDEVKLRVRIEKMLINFLRSNAVLNKQHVDR